MKPFVVTRREGVPQPQMTMLEVNVILSKTSPLAFDAAMDGSCDPAKLELMGWPANELLRELGTILGVSRIEIGKQYVLVTRSTASEWEDIRDAVSEAVEHYGRLKWEEMQKSVLIKEQAIPIAMPATVEALRLEVAAVEIPEAPVDENAS